MRFFIRAACAVVLFAAMPLCPQAPDPMAEPPEPSQHDVRLPNGKMQRDEILKEDHEKNLADAEELIRMTRDLKADIEKNTRYVFSLPTVKKTEEIEKLARRIRSRMKRN